MTTPISLASGITFDDPWETLRAMRERPDYPIYDSAPTFEDDELGILEITLSIMLSSGVTSEMASRLFLGRSKAKEWLELIPHELDLVNATSIDFENFGKLIDALQIHQFRLGRLTKILHKKRPRFIPVIDSVVCGHYRRLEWRGKGSISLWLGWSATCYGLTTGGKPVRLKRDSSSRVSH